MAIWRRLQYSERKIPIAGAQYNLVRARARARARVRVRVRVRGSIGLGVA